MYMHGIIIIIIILIRRARQDSGEGPTSMCHTLWHSLYTLWHSQDQCVILSGTPYILSGTPYILSGTPRQDPNFTGCQTGRLKRLEPKRSLFGCFFIGVLTRK